MSIAKLIRSMLPASLALLSACGPTAEQYASLRSDLQMLREILSRQDRQLRRLTTHIMYCSDEVSNLLGRVDQECSASEDHICTLQNANIMGEVASLDPSGQGKFLSLMQDHKHVPLYALNPKLGLPPVERKMLRDLVKPAWLNDGRRQTRILVVSHPEDDRPGSIARATQRSKMVIDEIYGIAMEMEKPTAIEPTPEPPPAGEHALVSMAVEKHAPSATNMSAAEPPPSGEPQTKPPTIPKSLQDRVLHWVFRFSSKNDVLRSEDKPKRPLDITSSVWVFRVDC